MVHGKNRIPYWIDRRLTGLAGSHDDATISLGLPIEPEDSQYGKYRSTSISAGTAAMYSSWTPGTWDAKIAERGGAHSRRVPNTSANAASALLRSSRTSSSLPIFSYRS